MKDLIKDIKFINDSKEFKNKDVQIEQLITDFIKQDRSEQLILNGVVHSGFYCMDAENSNGSCHCPKQCNSCVGY